MMAPSGAPASAVAAAAAILRRSGPLGLFRGYWATNSVWLPWNIIYIATYEHLRRQVRSRLELEEHEALPAAATSTAAFAAASAAAVLTHPPDVIKTRLQVRPLVDSSGLLLISHAVGAISDGSTGVGFREKAANHS